MLRKQLLRDPSAFRQTTSDGPSDLTAAQAARARIDMLRGTVHYGLDALDIGLPLTVAAPVRVADLDAEGNALVAEIALCHTCRTSFKGFSRYKSLVIIAEYPGKCKAYFSIFPVFLFCCQTAGKKVKCLT